MPEENVSEKVMKKEKCTLILMLKCSFKGRGLDLLAAFREVYASGSFHVNSTNGSSSTNQNLMKFAGNVAQTSK